MPEVIFDDGGPPHKPIHVEIHNVLQQVLSFGQSLGITYQARQHKLLVQFVQGEVIFITPESKRDCVDEVQYLLGYCAVGKAVESVDDAIHIDDHDILCLIEVANYIPRQRIDDLVEIVVARIIEAASVDDYHH